MAGTDKIRNQVMVSGQRFPTRLRDEVRDFPFPSLTQTGIAADTAFQIYMGRATEWPEFMEMVQRVAGCNAVPKILSINVSVIQTVTMPDIPGLTQPYEASFYERRSGDDINLSWGVAASAYTRTKTFKASLLQYFLDHFIAPETCSAARLAHPDCAVSTSRVRRSDFDHAGLGGGIEVSEDHLAWGRQYRPFSNLDAGPMRTIGASTGAPVSEPAENMPVADVYHLATTWDGVMGAEAQGVAASDVASTEKPWYVNMTLRNRTTLYRQGVVGQNATFSTFTVRVSVTWVANEGNTEGAVWMLRDDLQKLNGPSQSIFNPPDVQDAAVIGFMPLVHNPENDGGRGYWLRLSSGPATPFDVEVRFIYPSFNVATNFWTQGSVLQVGDQNSNDSPEITNTLAYGYQQLEQWNYMQKLRQRLGGPFMSFPSYPELPIYAAAGERAYTTTQWCGAEGGGGFTPAYYGTAYGVGGANYPTNDAARLSTDYSRIAGIGGIFYPFAWGNPEIPGFPNVAFRTSTDPRTTIVQPVQGWTPPTHLTTNQSWPITALYRRKPYSAFKTSTGGEAGECAHPSVNPVALNVALAKTSANAKMGEAITTTFAMPTLTMQVPG